MRSRRFMSWVMAALVLACLLGAAVPSSAAPGHRRPAKREKLDKVLKSRSNRVFGTSRVIITLNPNWDPSSDVRRLGGRLGRRLRSIDGMVVELPNWQLRRLADHPAIQSIHYDRPIGGQLNRVAATIGASAVRGHYGYDGAGVGVAVIDSGITTWHDDLTYQGWSSAVRTKNGQRVTAFVDFVNGQTQPYDDNGHGTHVAGIIGGNGYDSYGARGGVAPGAHLVSLKVLDDKGRGVISDVIGALDWVVANRASHNIRVVNLSVGAAVTESYMTDPLTLAAKRVSDAGIVVVTAAGNLGKNSSGEVQYGGITAPGNAPWVLTVGASTSKGTPSRYDDDIAGYSSRGPSAIDYQAKPDLVAPGTGIVSLTDPSSNFYANKQGYLLRGSRNTAYKPYLSLSGTSMAAPVVSGTVALMLQANPNLTPNLVKGILQYTAERRNHDALTQGAGFLNAYGAVQLSRFFKQARYGDRFPSSSKWSKQILWGNHRLSGGVLKPNGSAWALNIVWGTAADVEGDNIVWGTLCGGPECDNIVWGTLDELGDNIVWGTAADVDGDNIVWGTLCGGPECDNIVWGTLEGDENIVWGTLCGGPDCDNIVWGTAMDLDNIVWGTAMELDNIVWGTTSGLVDNIVWGTAAEGEDITWGSNDEDAVLFDDPNADPVVYDPGIWEEMPVVPIGSPEGGGGYLPGVVYYLPTLGGL